MTEYEFEVALSFAGEDRAYARRVAEALRAAGVGPFFDEFQAVHLWGRDLAVEFERICGRASRYVVPFVSCHYAVKGWPNHEFRSALAAVIEHQGERILPVRLDSTPLPGLRSTIGYLDGQTHTPEQVAEAILDKLGKAGQPEAASAVRLPRIPPAEFNPYAEAERAVEHLRLDLTRRANALTRSGYGVHAQERNGRFILRVMRSGRTIYSLDIWIGGGWGENTIASSVVPVDTPAPAQPTRTARSSGTARGVGL